MEPRAITEDQLDALLAERDPIDLAGLESRDLDGSLAALLETIPRRRLRPERRIARRRRRIRLTLGTRLTLGVGLAATGALAASLIGFNVLGSGGTPLSDLQPPAALAAELDRIATATAAGPAASRRDWLYIELMRSVRQSYALQNTAHPPVVSYRVTETDQIWTNAVHDSTRARVTFTHFAFASAEDQRLYAAHRAALAPELSPLPVRAGRSASLDEVVPAHLDDLSPIRVGNGIKVPLNRLPTDPVGLDRVLGDISLAGLSFTTRTAAQRASARATTITQRALGQWIGLVEILTASTSTSQRAEAYRALTLVHFVRVVGPRRDTRGRRGVGIEFRLPGNTPQLLIVDPSTGNPLSEADGALSTLWLTRATVDSLTALPNGGSLPLPRTRHPRDSELMQLGQALEIGFAG